MKRFGPAWFMRNYRSIQAPEDRIPQQYFTYFERVKAAQKAAQQAALTSLRASTSLRGHQIGTEGLAEVVAHEAVAGAAEIAQNLGEEFVSPASVSGADNSLA